MSGMLRSRMKAMKVRLFNDILCHISEYLDNTYAFTDTEEASETDFGKSEEYTEIKEQ